MRAFKRYSRHMRSIGVLWVTGRTVGLFLLTSLVISVMSSTLPSLEQNIVLSQNFEQTTGRSAELEVEGTPWPIAKVRSTS